jgi:acyl-CoA thioester hydrolase
MPAETIHQMRVRYNECDPIGIVFNSNYLVYADVAANEFWREHLGGYQAFNDLGLDMVLAEANVRFRRPLRFDEEFTVRASPGVVTERSLTIDFDFRRQGDPVAEVKISYVCVDSTEHGPRPIPEEILVALGAQDQADAG